MDEALARADDTGQLPSGCWSRKARSARTSSRAPSGSASGSTTSTSAIYRVDPDAAKLVTPAAAKRYQALPVSFAGERTLLVAMSDPANVLALDDIGVMTGYEVRPAVASPADIEQAARAPRGPRLRQRRRRPRSRTTARYAEPHRPEPVRAGRADVRLQGAGADQLRRLRRGLVGHPARAPGDQGGRRARLVRHPLRARRRGHARPLPDRRRAPGGRRHPRQRRARRGLAREDPRRPRHRRAPHAAGRPHLARGRRQADRPPCRDAAVRLRRERRHANPGPVARS